MPIHDSSNSSKKKNAEGHSLNRIKNTQTVNKILLIWKTLTNDCTLFNEWKIDNRDAGVQRLTYDVHNVRLQQLFGFSCWFNDWLSFSLSLSLLMNSYSVANQKKEDEKRGKLAKIWQQVVSVNNTHHVCLVLAHGFALCSILTQTRAIVISFIHIRRMSDPCFCINNHNNGNGMLWREQTEHMMKMIYLH